MTDTVASTRCLQELTPVASHASNVATFPLHTLNFSLGSFSESQARHLAIQRFCFAQSISPLHPHLHLSLSISSQPEPFPSISQGFYLPKFTFLPTPPCCTPSSTVSWLPLYIFIRLACSLSLPSLLLLRVNLSIPCIPFCRDLFCLPAPISCSGIQQVSTRLPFPGMANIRLCKASPRRFWIAK